MYETLWIFFVYAFLGWCTEVAFAALNSGAFVNRGFLNGPLCPIYGFGAVIVLTLLQPLKSNFMLLFLGSVLLTSLLELVTGWALEKLFHQRWWDYSDTPFNIGGYICLRFSVAWGFACLIVVDIVHPTILWFIRHIPHTLGLVELVVFAAAMAVDVAATVRTISRINHQLSRIDELASRIREASDDLGENLADRVLDAAQRGEDWREELDDWKEELEDWRQDVREDIAEAAEARQERRRQRRQELRTLRDKLDAELGGLAFGQRRLMRAFPAMRSLDHRQAMERLRRRMERSGKKG